jgi:hypothetical protein
MNFCPVVAAARKGNSVANSGVNTHMPCGCVLLAYFGFSLWDGQPRTIRYLVDSWQNQSWGLHNIDRQRTRCEVAISGDGSRMNRCEAEYFRHYFIPRGHSTIRTLYLCRENAGFVIDDATRTVRGGTCRCTWEPFRAYDDDYQCARTAEARLPGSKFAGSGKIAGHSVLRYRLVDEQETEREVAFAPTAGCEVMEEVQTWKGTLGIPGAKWHYIVTSYTSGEPDPTVFQIPAGYTLREKE